MRTWGGVMDMTMDGSPILGKLPVEGLYIDGGWCYGGFKATPGAGWCHAWTIANDEPHPLNAAFTLDRFHRGEILDEKGAGGEPAGALKRGFGAGPSTLRIIGTGPFMFITTCLRLRPCRVGERSTCC